MEQLWAPLPALPQARGLMSSRGAPSRFSGQEPSAGSVAPAELGYLPCEMAAHRVAEGLPLTAQPQSCWITGEDCANGACMVYVRPTCVCKLPSKSSHPAEHATWECPLRFWRQYGGCPEFCLTASGTRHSGTA
jgi:hypothetical protein